jgi:putative ABC transport system permease protein
LTAVRLVETAKLGLSAILAQKLRSFLTLLGVVIGITAVVVTISLIQGFNTLVEKEIAGMDSKSFSLIRFNMEDWKNADTMALAQRRNKEVTLSDLEYLREHVTLVDRIGAKSASISSQVRAGGEAINDVQVYGATPNLAEIENINISAGRYFAEWENGSAAPCAFIGAEVADKLFPYTSAIGQEIIIGGAAYRVIGIAAAKGTLFGMPRDTFVVLPLKTHAKRFGRQAGLQGLSIIGDAKAGESFDEAVEEVRFLMRKRRNLSASESDNFGLFTPDAVTGLRDRLFGPIFIVALAVPSIALLVGGIVVMNIMLVSVTERTKEIGLRRALGARQADVLRQFLGEAVMLATIGGLMGTLLAWVLNQILSKMLFPVELSIGSVILAVAVSSGVGILSGLFPARKAAGLDPIVALRME